MTPSLGGFDAMMEVPRVVEAVTHNRHESEIIRLTKLWPDRHRPDPSRIQNLIEEGVSLVLR
jgi:hypothetical protein